MSDLETLRQSISQMSDEELVEHFRTIRKARRTPAPSTTKPRKPRQTGTIKAMPKTSELTPDAAAKLLAALGG